MDVYASEQEQVEQIKKWWKENWRSIASGVALGLGILYAYRAWQDHTRGNEEYGSITFQNIVTLIEQKKTDEADRLIRELRGRQPDSIYSVLAALDSAKLAVDAKDYTKATQQLQWVLDHAPLAEIQSLAKTRLARLYMQDGKFDMAWSTVAELDKKDKLPSVQELKGDVQIALGKPAEALKYYRLAQTLLGTGSGEAAGLQVKLDDLGSSVGKTSQLNAANAKAADLKAVATEAQTPPAEPEQPALPDKAAAVPPPVEKK